MSHNTDNNILLFQSGLSMADNEELEETLDLNLVNFINSKNIYNDTITISPSSSEASSTGSISINIDEEFIIVLRLHN